jgi:hypothetical protein
VPPSGLTTLIVTRTRRGNLSLRFDPESTIRLELTTEVDGHGAPSLPMNTAAPGRKPDPLIWRRNGSLEARMLEILGRETVPAIVMLPEREQVTPPSDAVIVHEYVPPLA